jgi:hypothetical protein
MKGVRVVGVFTVTKQTHKYPLKQWKSVSGDIAVWGQGAAERTKREREGNKRGSGEEIEWEYKKERKSEKKLFTEEDAMQYEKSLLDWESVRVTTKKDDTKQKERQRGGKGEEGNWQLDDVERGGRGEVSGKEREWREGKGREGRKKGDECSKKESRNRTKRQQVIQP